MNKYAEYSHTKDIIRYRACERKRAYPSREAAYQKGCCVYECVFCGKFHRSSSGIVARAIRRADDYEY